MCMVEFTMYIYIYIYIYIIFYKYSLYIGYFDCIKLFKMSSSSKLQKDQYFQKC
jgi:hypothetical protein